jgi:hypothetical protein
MNRKKHAGRGKKMGGAESPRPKMRVMSQFLDGERRISGIEPNN